MQTLHIATLEKVINVHRERNPSGPDCVNCKAVNVLGDLYGRMIYFRLSEVNYSTLTDKELAALNLQETK